MKFSQEQKNEIRTLFCKMNSKSDFLSLLNKAKMFEYGDKVIDFEERQLNYYINKDSIFKTDANSTIKYIDNPYYNSFSIKKKSGKDRVIYSPIEGLKNFQKALNIILQCVFDPHEASTGFVIGKSIVDNAKVHVGQTYVYNIDLKDFFSSIDKSRVWGRLLVPPFNLNTTPERRKIANMIAGLSCTSIEVERFINGDWKKISTSVLPQGSPVSPVISNAICERLDRQLTGVSKRFGLNYSRYADDITFSSKHNLYQKGDGSIERIFAVNSTFDLEVRRIISKENFHIQEDKIRLQKEGYRQEVTGLLVNNKINVARTYIKQLRQWIYYLETYGYDKSYSLFLDKYLKEKYLLSSQMPNMLMVIKGKLLYLKMVKGDNNETYLKLKNRFDSILISHSPINLILNIWENEGIEKAMEIYYRKS
ncbi:reverse transcriptase family protein [Chryseobacterium sp. S90]|uniref:reverse transcriptase family protein n=1 Tax=Chryseobacterium sp. S90 TaxID=3395373 RepID=UPI0039BD3E8E